MTQIRKDYQEKGNRSFLAEFLLSEKRKKVKEQAEKIAADYHRKPSKKRERHDLLAEFLWTLEQRDKKKKGEDWFIEAIIDWIERLQKDDRFTLYYKREKTFAGDMASKGEACREIINLKKEKKKPSAELLDKASGEITDCLLEQIIPQWLYNLGCPLYSPGEYKPGRQSSARNTALDLVDAWCSTHGTGGAVAQPGAAFDEAAYQELYELLERANKIGALIPVRVDPETGVGIYIVGRELYANGSPADMMHFQYYYGKHGKSGAARSCGIEAVGYWQSAEDAGQSAGISLGDPEGTLYGFPSITEANKWFINKILEDQDLRFSGFQEHNGSEPEGLPKQFRKYFERSSEDFDKLTDEDLAETRAVFQQKQ